MKTKTFLALRRGYHFAASLGLVLATAGWPPIYPGWFRAFCVVGVLFLIVFGWDD